MKTIEVFENVFLLNTEHPSYLFTANEFGYLEHIHYGRKVDVRDAEALRIKHHLPYGTTITVKDEVQDYSLDHIPLEYGVYGLGDFKESALEVQDTFLNSLNFLYDSYEIRDEECPMQHLPSSYGSENTLIVHLKDKEMKLDLDLYYTVYPKCDVITRRAVLCNRSGKERTLHKMMSFCLDLYEHDLNMMDFSGAWIKEMHLSRRKIERGTTVIQSRTGFSSAKQNPGFLIYKDGSTENHGRVWGFNLVYSGNHYSSISRDEYGIHRILSGINPERFHFRLIANASFESPEAVLSYSDNGFNGLSHHFHDFINEHIVRSNWKKKERPVLINDWEAFGADFKKDQLVKLAKDASKLGIELFVLDDGWFSNRNDDAHGLGDYDCNEKKLPGGLSALSEEIHKLNMSFGLWFEPESVNPDSKLYAAHPEWALVEKERGEVLSRHQLLLDLRNPDVRDYIVENVSRIIDENKIDYVKWDMNRHMTGVSGAYSYEYILGLYDVLKRIFYPRPHVLLESCASGGNRFDLGMLCFSPQIWASDDTDALERIDIQKGYSYLYPLSTLGAHVSATPHGMTLRKTPLETRFTISAYGALGYELDLGDMSSMEKEEVKKQVAYYKEHRRTFQYGTFYRFDEEPNYEMFEVVNESEAIVSKFRRIVHASPEFDKLYAMGLEEKERYVVISRPYLHHLSVFGHLINYITPVKVDGNGHIMTAVSKRKGMDAAEQVYHAGGSALKSGIYLNSLFLGTGYNKQIRLPLDYGSDMYQITKEEEEEEPE